MSIEQYFVRTSAPFIIVSKLLSHYSHLLLTSLTERRGRGGGGVGCSSFFFVPATVNTAELVVCSIVCSFTRT